MAAMTWKWGYGDCLTVLTCYVTLMGLSGVLSDAEPVKVRRSIKFYVYFISAGWRCLDHLTRNPNQIF